MIIGMGLPYGKKVLNEDTSCGLLCCIYYPCMHLFSPESGSANTQATSVRI